MRGVTVAWLLAVSGLTLVGCGEGTTARSMAPSAISSPVTSTSAPVPAGTVLGVSSAETGGAIEGVSVMVAGHTYVSDSMGNVALSEGTIPGALLELHSPDTLERETLLRSAGARFTLWPSHSPTGLDEAYTRAVVYTWDDSKGSGSSPLYRLSSTTAALVPSAELLNDPQAMAAHQHAADALNAASGGGVRYVVSANPPAGAVPVNTVLDTKDDGCKDRVLAFTSIRLRGGEISSARIVFCNLQAARDGTVTHEAGHSFGLGHSPDPSEVMHAFKLLHQADTFSAREALSMRLMLQRHGGNRFPDNDRAVSAASSGEVKIVCR